MVRIPESKVHTDIGQLKLLKFINLLDTARDWYSYMNSILMENGIDLKVEGK